MSKILFVIGTRPELIKIAPIIIAFKNNTDNKNFNVLFTAQHKDILKQYSKIFGITADYELDFMNKGQSLGMLTARAFSQTDAFFEQLKEKDEMPDYVVVQGDTTTVFSVGLSAFYKGVKVAHVEAGLRTYDLQNPFPEEFNRRAVSIFADINLAPTKLSAENLMKDGVEEDKIKIVGNTVIDALQFIKRSKPFAESKFIQSKLNDVKLIKGKVVLITFHRRENQNNNLLELISAIDLLAKKYSDIYFVWTLHPNPKIKKIVLKSDISNNENVILVPPLDYMDILKLMTLSKVIMSDSGGIQEEAPSFGVPVIVLRKVTERPEGVIAKKVFLTDVIAQTIINKFNDLYSNYNPIDTKNPYGDGKSAERIMNILQLGYL